MTQPLPIGATVDGYRVEAHLGAGAMADVFRVRDDAGRPYALKLVRTTRPRSLARLEREAELLAGLHHPHVVQLEGMVHHQGRLGLVLELVHGLDLEQLIQRYDPSLERVDDLARQLFEGLAAVHRAGLVHRDLKPANVLISVGQGVVAKLADFGLARDTDSVRSPRLTWSGAPIGTPSHMAPEQQRAGHYADARSDVFALGTILYELLTGQKTFGGTDAGEVFDAVAEGRYAPLRQLRPHLPRRMVDAVDAALQIDPAARPACVEDLAALWWDGPAPAVGPSVWEPEHVAELLRLAAVPRAPATGTVSAPPASSPVAPPERPTAIRRPAERPTVPARPPLAPASGGSAQGGHPLWWTLGGAFGGAGLVALALTALLLLAGLAWLVVG